MELEEAVRACKSRQAEVDATVALITDMETETDRIQHMIYEVDEKQGIT